MANLPPLLPVDAPLGAKIVAFLARSFVPIAIATGLSTLVALGIVAALPRPSIDVALVEVGARFLDEPLEHPLRTSFRLQAICQEIADRVDPSAEIKVRPRRAEKTNAMTRVLDLTVEATTSSAARAIIDQGLSRLIAEHSDPFSYEKGLLEQQQKVFELGVTRLEAQLEEEEGEVRSALAGRLYETRRLIDGGGSALAKHALQPTRVVSRASRAEPARSRAPVLLLGGILLGALLGVSWALARIELERSDRQSSEVTDPFLAEFFTLTRRFRGLILVLGLVGAAAGGFLGSRGPAAFSARAIVEAAEIPPKGPIEDLANMGLDLETFISGQVIAGRLPEGTELEARVIRDQPPTATKQGLVELVGTSPTTAGAEAAVRLAAQRMIDAENPEIEAERARIERVVTALEADLGRLDAMPETLENHTLRVNLVIDRTELRRRLSSVRVHPARLVMAPRPEPVDLGPRITGFGAALSLLGLMLGYLIAFFSAGVGYLRGMEPKGNA